MDKFKNAEKLNNRPRLRLIRCGCQYEILLGSLRIVASPKNAPPFRVAAVAAEEDTFLVLSADPVVHETLEHPIRIMTQVIEMQPEPPGSILVKGKHPLRFLAIVHDLNQEPSWKEEWISSAINKIFIETESRRLKSIALPLLGNLYGSLDQKRFIELLRMALLETPPTNLERLWLIVPIGTSHHTIEMLKSP